MNDLIPTVSKAVFKKICAKVRGNVEVTEYNEDLVITIRANGLKFTYTVSDIYWSCYYGVTAQQISDVVLKSYSGFISGKFFK